MSKKKSGSSTMTLKNFHGGSIPSDLPLPSAPGLLARPPDRPPSGSGSSGPAGIPGIRNPRPGSAGGGAHRSSDPPFLPGFIGRHFDEDERKPFDSPAPPRCPLSDPAPRPATLLCRSDPVPRPGLSPAVHGGGPVGVWGPRRDPAAPDPLASAPVPVSAAERLAQASAVEKISSGRWGIRPAMANLPAVEVIGAEEFRPGSNNTRGGGPHVLLLQQQVVVAEAAGERQKLKLLPRMRPVEADEARVSEEKQFYQPPAEPLHMEKSHEINGNMNMPRPGSAGTTNSGSQIIERPRLNLKPRSLPVEELDKVTERERKAVFGGARPRELVLKERGVDDIVATTPEVTSPANRAKNDTSKTELKSEPTPTTRRGERFESFQSEQRNGRDLERKEYRPDLAKVERTSWRNDNRRNTRENEKAVERHQEPDTWRKPVVEQPKPELPVPGLRHGKAASALELAQAFSRSVSDVKSDNHVPSQRSLPTRVQVPFSRLTDTRDFYSGPSQRHIDGY